MERNLWPRGRKALRSIRGVDRVFGYLGLVAIILFFIFLLVDIAYVIPIVALMAGVLIVYGGRGNLPVAVIGGIVAILGIIDAYLIAVGGALAL